MCRTQRRPRWDVVERLFLMEYAMRTLGRSSRASTPSGVLRKNNGTHQNIPKKLKDGFPKLWINKRTGTHVQEVLRAMVCCSAKGG